VPLPAVSIFEMITRIRIEQANELISRSFDLIADQIDCTVTQCIESESEKLRGTTFGASPACTKT